MRAKSRSPILAAFAFLAIFGMSEALKGSKGELPAQLSVRQQVDSEVSNLQKNMKACKNLAERWQFLEKSEAEIHRLRAKNTRQFEKDEASMDLLVASLDEIPGKAVFEPEQCPTYREDLLAHFDADADDDSNPPSPVSPPLAKALQVLDLLCRK